VANVNTRYGDHHLHVRSPLPLRRSGGQLSGGAMQMSMPNHGALTWSLGGLAVAIVMWCVMMVAMMLPSALPALLLFRAQQKSQGDVLAGLTALFGVGYLAIWFACSLLAASLQWTLQGLMLLSPQMTVVSTAASAGVLALAGLYQFTPWKEACLTHCQSPLDFLVMHWENGRSGALRMGARHGLFCVGCCWALMAVLFVIGIMNLAWVALLSVLVLLEKLVVRGPWPSRAAGASLLAWAGYAAYYGMGV
jgi:predicted metal-binding membrane protein